MLEVHNLVKEYKKFRAVDDLSFVIRPGEIVGLLGPNGAGKTTALRCIAGILRPTAGQVRINGFDLRAQPGLAKGRLAFVPEMPSLYELLTVDEHLRFVAMCFNSLPFARSSRHNPVFVATFMYSSSCGNRCDCMPCGASLTKMMRSCVS